MAQKITRDESNSAVAIAFSGIRRVPAECGDVSVTTTPAVLFADASNTAVGGTRRVRVFNTSSSATVGLFFVEAGSSLSGLLIADSAKIGPGNTWEFVVGANIRVGAVASSGSVTVNCFVDDLL